MESKQFWEELIKLYESHACLWQYDHEDFTNKNKKNDAMKKLVQKCKEINPHATKEYVLKKIHNMRASFRREWKKVEASKKSGCSAEKVYQSSLWYFDLIKFTVEQELSYQTYHNKALRNLYMQSDSKSDIDPLDSDSVLTSLDFECDASLIKQEESHEHCEPTETVNQMLARKRPRYPVNEDGVSNENHLLFVDNNLVKEKQTESANQISDEFDVLGQHLAIQMRKINKESQRVYVQKVISDAIFYAQLGRLTEHTVIKLAPPQMGETFLSE